MNLITALRSEFDIENEKHGYTISRKAKALPRVWCETPSDVLATALMLRELDGHERGVLEERERITRRIVGSNAAV